MEVFILKLIGILCITTIAMTIIIARRNDTDIWAIVIATIFELLGMLIIYMPIDQIIALISNNIYLTKINTYFYLT